MMIYKKKKLQQSSCTKYRYRMCLGAFDREFFNINGCFILSEFCDNIWGFSYKYVPDSEPCIVMDFEGDNPNVHGNNPWKMGVPDSCPKDLNGLDYKVITQIL